MTINVLVIFMILIAIWRVFDGFRNGLVKELISLITLVILAFATVLLGRAINSYVDKQILNAASALLLFLILCIAHSALKFVFFSAKLVSKLPVVSTVNKLLGALFGVVEAVLFAWVIYTLNMYMDLGVMGEEIVELTRDNVVLTYIYERNYLAYEVEKLLPLLPFSLHR